MSKIEMSVFEIANLKDLSCNYRLYKVRGISCDPDNPTEYEKKLNQLIKSLCFKSWSPCVKVVKDGIVYIAQPDGYRELPQSCQIIAGLVKLDKSEELHRLDFGNLTDETLPLAIRFLQSQLNRSLISHPGLWQPYTGGPVFNKTPDSEFRNYSRNIDLYRGFSLRVVELPGNHIGIAIDQRTKYVQRNPLPAKIDLDYFRKIKGRSVIYEYGKHLYETQLHELDDLNVSERMLKDGESLYAHMQQQYENIPKTTLFTGLRPECSVLVYKNNRDESRNMPSVMCRLTVNTRDVRDAHRYSILPPHLKRNDILVKTKMYLQNLDFNGVKISLTRDMLQVNKEIIKIPTLQFGNNRCLSIDNLSDPKDFGKTKETYLLSPDAGFFRRKPFGPQYFFLPKSANDTWGKKFISDLCGMVKWIYKTDYQPEIIEYDDSTKSYAGLSKTILDAATQRKRAPGYGVVMIPELSSTRLNKEDELSNFVMRKMRELDINVSIIHTTIGGLSLEINGSNGTWETVNDDRQRSRYQGYLKNVVINKVLLLNDVKPFILKDKIHSDLVIGIDIKNSFAGFTFVTGRGEEIYFSPSKTKLHEKLRKGVIKDAIKSYVKNRYSIAIDIPLKNVLVHRDGRLFDEEKAAVNEAIEDLKKEGLVDVSCGCTFMEIRKTFMPPMRMFDVSFDHSRQTEFVLNPFNGTVYTIGNDAYLVTTGRPFAKKGTSLPLRVIYGGGKLSFKEVLSDTFALTHLTWTKIDDCSRVPITIRYGDLRLRETAGDYDEDDYEYGQEEGGVEDE